MAPSTATRLFGHGGVYTLSRLLNQAVGIPVLAINARLLGVDGFGIISLMSTVGGFLGVLMVQGLQASWFRLRFDESDPAGIRSLETTIVWYLTASGVAVVALLTLLGEPIARRVTPGVEFMPLGLLTAVAAFANVYPSLFERKLQVEERSVAFGVFNLARTLVTAGLVVFFVAALRRGARGAIEATALGAVLAGIAALILIRPGWLREVSRPRLARSLSYGLPLVPHSLAGMTNDVIDRVLINRMLGLSATGIYSMGYRLAAMGQVVATSLNQAFGPIFIRALNGADKARAAGDDAAAADAMRQVGRLGLMTVACVACVVLALTAVAREVLMVLATPAFADSWQVVAVVGAGVVAWACYFPWSQSIFYNPARVRWMVVVTGAAALVNIGANLILIPKWGIMGAASATLASDVVLALMAYAFARKSAPVPYQRARWLSALVCVAAGLAGLWWLDATVDGLLPRLALKVAWAAAAALLTLRAANVRRDAVRQLWPGRGAATA
jgi:O-antigen/teichoic acid export membrane protein